VNDSMDAVTRRLAEVDAFVYGDEIPITPERIARCRQILTDVETGMDRIYRVLDRAGVTAEIAPVFGRRFKVMLVTRQRLDRMEVIYTRFEDLDDGDIYAYTPDQLRPNCPDCGREVPLPDYVEDPTDYWVGRCAGGHVHLYELEAEKTG